MIGKSFSACIADICRGKVEEKDVEKIISRTSVRTASEWDKVIQIYKQGSWRDFPDKAEQIARRFIDSEKIEQPRLRGETPADIGQDFWIVK